MVNFAGEDAADARFNMTYSGGFGEGSTPPPEAFEAPMPDGVGGFIPAEKWKRAAQEWSPNSELTFNWPNGAVSVRLARVTLEQLGTFDLIDLRVLRAHLEEASFVVANALARHEQQR